MYFCVVKIKKKKKKKKKKKNDDDDDDEKKMYQCIKFPSLYLKKLLWPADEKTMMGNLQLVRVKDTFFFATTEIRRANLNDNMMIDRQK